LNPPPAPPSAAQEIQPIVDLLDLDAEHLASTLGASPRVLEIGFGRGELLLATATEQPQRRFLGVEVSRKRVEKMGRRVVRAGLGNLRLVRAPIEPLIESVLPDASFAECWVHCPDPWPKKRHHRRRFFQTHSVSWLARVLAPGALLYASTDHVEYAHWIAQVMSGSPDFENLCAPLPWSSARPAQRAATAYETEWLADGRTIAYFSFRRK
jgi:tRNA (guanine-N7-)-methyltransferase